MQWEDEKEEKKEDLDSWIGFTEEELGLKTITPDARAWIISLACMKPKDLGYPHELWTQRLLAEDIRDNCTEKGFPEAVNISSGTVSKILGASNIKPHKITSYIHRHDPDFESKSAWSYIPTSRLNY